MNIDEPSVSPFVLRYLDVLRKNIKGLRGDMSQEEFAKKVGVSRTTIQRIEGGKNFEIVSLLKIAETFKIYPFNLCLTEEEKIKLKEESIIFRDTIKREITEEVLREIRKELKK